MQKFVVFIVLIIALLQALVEAKTTENTEMLGFEEFVYGIG